MLSSIRNEGITLIELLITVSIIGILTVALAFSFRGWTSTSNIESQIKEMHLDISSARAKAVQRNRMHFVQLSPTQYSIYEDTNPNPDGNRTLEASDTRMLQRTVRYPLIFTYAAAPSVAFNFNTRGSVSGGGSIRISGDLDGDGTRDVDPDYDCLILATTSALSPTNIDMGKWNDTSSICVAK